MLWIICCVRQKQWSELQYMNIAKDSLKTGAAAPRDLEASNTDVCNDFICKTIQAWYAHHQ